MIVDELNAAEKHLINLIEDDEAFTSSVRAARASINAARARALDLLEKERDRLAAEVERHAGPTHVTVNLGASPLGQFRTPPVTS